MNRLAAPAVLALVTPLLAAYGSSGWSWLGGPVASIAIRALQPRDESFSARAMWSSLRRGAYQLICGAASQAPAPPTA